MGRPTWLSRCLRRRRSQGSGKADLPPSRGWGQKETCSHEAQRPQNVFVHAWASMGVYACVHVYVCVCMCLCVWLHVRMCTSACVCAYTRMHLCTTCVCVRACACASACIVCACVRMWCIHAHVCAHCVCMCVRTYRRLRVCAYVSIARICSV